MNQSQIDLIEIVRWALHGNHSKEMVTKDVVLLAQKHQVQNLVYAATEAQALKNVFMFSTAQSMSQQYSAEEMLRYFEAHQLYIMPVKGICTKNRYPDSVLRTMGDIDILTKVNQNQDVREAMNALGYTGFQEGRKHDHYLMPPDIVVEVHRDLVDGESEFYSYYRNIWNRCKPREGSRFIYEMSLEDEYIFNFLHLTGHFKSGGIGLRFLVDIYVYEQLSMDKIYVEKEFDKLGLLSFYHNLKDLSLYWFGSDEQRKNVKVTLLLQKMGEYIISSDLYGSSENYANLNAGKGRLKTLLHACFPGYHSMKSMFPWLRPALLPFAWILRAVRVFKYRKENIRIVWNTSMTGDEKKGTELRKFYKECGLKM